MLTRTGQAGFSITEVVTVLAIGAVLAATAAPVASAIRDHHQMSATTRRLAFEITRARMQAVGQNRFVRIRLVGTDQYLREYSTDGLTYVTDGGAVTLPSGFSVFAANEGAPRFDRQGLAPTATSLTIVGPTGARTVHVSTIGRVRAP